VFTLNSLPPPLEAQLVAKLLKAEPATIGQPAWNRLLRSLGADGPGAAAQ